MARNLQCTPTPVLWVPAGYTPRIIEEFPTIAARLSGAVLFDVVVIGPTETETPAIESAALSAAVLQTVIVIGDTTIENATTQAALSGAVLA